MEARNRHLDEWFSRIRSGQLALPRFQRYEAWGRGEVASLLQTVLRGLPAGAALILEVGDAEPFISRKMAGAPTPTERITEHLLDGQQRLTALWRSLRDDYLDCTYVVSINDCPADDEGVGVTGHPRYVRNGQRYPRWIDNPDELCRRDLFPLRLCQPGDQSKEIKTWLEQAVGDNTDEMWRINARITDLRARVAGYNVPFLSLPTSTPKDVALDVFIKLNTSSVKLTAFDIVVAQFEEATGQSLHDLVDEVHSAVPSLARYCAVEDLVLDVASLRSDWVPGQASYQRLDLKNLAASWGEIIDGIDWMVSFLEDEHIFDGARLPSVSVLPVLAALKASLPPSLDALGNARVLLRKYLWRAFLTARYESSAGTRALQDYRGLRDRLSGDDEAAVPIFDYTNFPVPTAEVLAQAGWPKTRQIISRGILALSLRAGAVDLADGSPATPTTIVKREYHHLFPDNLLQNVAGLDQAASFRALNCALVTWNTNRNISAKAPLKYLRERTERATLGEQAVRDRLRSHLIPYDSLAAAGFDHLAPDLQPEAVAECYEAFIADRASIIADYARAVCDGEDPTL